MTWLKITQPSPFPIPSKPPIRLILAPIHKSFIIVFAIPSMTRFVIAILPTPSTLTITLTTPSKNRTRTPKQFPMSSTVVPTFPKLPFPVVVSIEFSSAPFESVSLTSSPAFTFMTPTTLVFVCVFITVSMLFTASLCITIDDVSVWSYAFNTA